jgi:glycosyltransferase involved in cell wall biosynthesis
MLVGHKTTGDADVSTIPPGRLQQRVMRLQNLPFALHPDRQRKHTWSLNWLHTSTAEHIRIAEPDIVHLHWVGNGLLPIQDFSRLGVPVVWTLHDSWAFTGGCHLPYDCHRFEQQCGTCPQLGSTFERDVSRWVWSRKRRHWRGIDFNIVTPSQWLADQARVSSLLGQSKITVIPNGVDVELFKPLDKAFARQVLNLPSDKNLIVFGAYLATQDPNKGFHHLLPALQQLADAGWQERAELLVFGSQRPAAAPDFRMPAHYFGSLHDEISLAVLYAAADVLVVPSLYESFGLVVVEGMACGTPCVGFRTSGVGEIINHQETGYLAEAFSTDELARGIQWVLEDDARRQRLSVQARQRVVDEFSLSQMSRQYAALYHENLL